MDYKNEIGLRYKEKLNNELNEYDCPSVIRSFFGGLSSEVSKYNYWITIRNFLEYMIDNKVIDNTMNDITCDDLNSIKMSNAMDYFNSINDDYKKSSMATKKKQLSSFFTFLKNNRDVDMNIIDAMPPKFKYKPPKTDKFPHKDDVDKMLIKASSNKNRFMRSRNLAIFYMFLGSGIRLTELCCLDIDDVDLDNESINVMRKGNYDEEYKDEVYLYGSIMTYLKDWMIQRELSGVTGNALFVNGKGERLSEKTVQYLFKQYSGSKVTPHMMRHLYATTLYEKSGHDESLVQDNMGHSLGSSVTLDSYITTRETNRELFKTL